MKIAESRNIKYFSISDTDEAWGIVVTTVGYQPIYYKYTNEAFSDSAAVSKINEARAIMKQESRFNISPEEIAKKIGIRYSWFRKMFK